MKKLLLIYVGIFCSVLVFGQTNFQKLTLDEACTKAKVEKSWFSWIFTPLGVPRVR